jgi:hypothetical protein
LAEDVVVVTEIWFIKLLLACLAWDTLWTSILEDP